MMCFTRWFVRPLLIFLAVFLVDSARLVAESEPSVRQTVRVMSCNVRYGTAADADNHWDLRKELLASVLRDSDADLIGTQEMLPFQAEYLKTQLDRYEYVGRSRELNNDQGEQCGIFFRQDRFVELERGSFWLSEQPETPGSRGWDAALPRMATWLKLFDVSKQRVFVILNTHFDHQGDVARTRSAELLRTYATRFADEYPLIVTGDFNTAENSPPYLALLAAPPAPVFDVFRRVHPQQQENEGTFNGFRGRVSGPRIDWILASPQWEPISSRIVRTNENDRYPSDHFPVFAELNY